MSIFLRKRPEALVFLSLTHNATKCRQNQRAETKVGC